MITTSNVEKNNLIVFIISFVYLLYIITSLPNLPIVNLLDKSRNGFLTKELEGQEGQVHQS